MILGIISIVCWISVVVLFVLSCIILKQGRETDSSKKIHCSKFLSFLAEVLVIVAITISLVACTQ